MAVTIDASGTVQSTASFVSSFNYTGLTIGTGLSNSYLVISVSFAGGIPSGISITWNGTSMTQIGLVSDSTGGQAACLFGLTNPTSGSNTAAVTWTNSSSVAVCGTSWAGVDQTTPFVNTVTLNDQASSSSGFATITSSIGDAVIAVFQTQLGTISVDHTQVYKDSINTGSASNRAAGASPNVTLGWSAAGSFTWCGIGTDLSAFVSKSSGFNMPMLGM